MSYVIVVFGVIFAVQMDGAQKCSVTNDKGIDYKPFICTWIAVKNLCGKVHNGLVTKKLVDPQKVSRVGYGLRCAGMWLYERHEVLDSMHHFLDMQDSNGANEFCQQEGFLFSRKTKMQLNQVFSHTEELFYRCTSRKQMNYKELVANGTSRTACLWQELFSIEKMATVKIDTEKFFMGDILHICSLINYLNALNKCFVIVSKINNANGIALLLKDNGIAAFDEKKPITADLPALFKTVKKNMLNRLAIKIWPSLFAAAEESDDIAKDKNMNTEEKLHRLDAIAHCEVGLAGVFGLPDIILLDDEDLDKTLKPTYENIGKLRGWLHRKITHYTLDLRNTEDVPESTTVGDLG